jgi:FkbM family methyltransferase
VQDNACTNVTVINKGIYNKNCELSFSYIEEVAGCSFVSETGVKEGIEEQISCINFDDWCIEENIQRIDLIKIDVEGAEILALTGMLTSLEKFRPKMIIEFNPGPIERFFGDDPRKLFNILQSSFNKL